MTTKEIRQKATCVARLLFGPAQSRLTLDHAILGLMSYVDNRPDLWEAIFDEACDINALLFKTNGQGDIMPLLTAYVSANAHLIASPEAAKEFVANWRAWREVS